MIGADWPLSGPFAQDGQATLSGAQAAVSDINASGGIKSLGGAKLKLVQADAGSTPDTATAATQRLVGDNPVAIAGSFLSSLTLAATQVSERAQIPFITEGFDDAITSSGFKYVFDYAPPASKIAGLYLGAVEQSLRRQGIQLSRVAVIGDDTAAAVPLQLALIKQFSANGTSIALQTRWTPPLQDASSIASKVAAAKPNVIFMIAFSFSDVSQLTATLRGQGVTAPIIQDGGQALLPQWRSLGAAATRGLASFVITFPLKKSQGLAASLAQRTHQPFVGQDQLDGYFAVQLIAAGLEQAKKASAQALRNALASIDLTSGPAVEVMPTDQIRFDSSGRIMPPFGVLVQWQKQPSGALAPCTIYPVQYAACTPHWK